MKKATILVLFLLLINQATALSFGASPERIYFNDYSSKSITVFNLDSKAAKFAITSNEDWIKAEKEILVSADSSAKIDVRIENSPKKEAVLYIRPMADSDLVPAVGVKIYNNLTETALDRITGRVILSAGEYSRNGVMLLLFVMVAGMIIYFVKKQKI